MTTMKFKYTFILLPLLLIVIGCEDFLDRPPLTNANDETAWTSEDKLRLYANQFYPDFFVGYASGWTTGSSLLSYADAPLVNYLSSDDVVQNGSQTNFTRAVPSSSIWNYELVRSTNIMVNRIENRMKSILSTEAYNHWLGVAKFFRAVKYADLVNTYGDVPYYNHIVEDTNKDDLYKPRTPRNEVMDSVYNDLKFAMENVRSNDGALYVNRYVVAAMVSRIALHEGTWQKYYYENNAQAQKFLELAIEAGDLVMNSGKYSIETDFRTLFTSSDLTGNDECILFRKYDASVNVTHHIASYSNPFESLNYGGTADLVLSFLCKDGQPWQNSTIANANIFSVDSLVKTRDSRFEATFYYKPTINSKGSYLFPAKFFPRYAIAIREAGGSTPTELSGNVNITDYPVLRLSEVLLNWIEAKAENATLGGAAVTQDDIDKSINEIRDRPLAPEAIAKGVSKTAPLSLAELPNDPERDSDVNPLIWEIRRERRMEFVFEYSRLADLKRWTKLEYMDTDANPFLLSGAWVNFPKEMSSELNSANANKFSIVKLNGSAINFNGTNKAEMVGFYKGAATKGRQPFLNQLNVNPYLSPVGKTQIDDYASRGYVLQQTEGWPQN